MRASKGNARLTLVENLSWFGHISWYAIFGYTFVICATYALQQFVIYPALEPMEKEPSYQTFGELCSLGWFAVSFVCMPWHDWEIHGNALRYFLWWVGMVLCGFVYRLLGTKGGSTFNVSLVSLESGATTTAQYWMFVSVFAAIGIIVVYWLCKYEDTYAARKRKNVFLRLLGTVGLLFALSYVVCQGECVYHLHHWWFGFCLVLLTTPTMTNNFDYFLQGVFWAFIIDSFVLYDVLFHKFYV